MTECKRDGCVESALPNAGHGVCAVHYLEQVEEGQADPAFDVEWARVQEQQEAYVDTLERLWRAVAEAESLIEAAELRAAESDPDAADLLHRVRARLSDVEIVDALIRADVD